MSAHKGADINKGDYSINNMLYPSQSKTQIKNLSTIFSPQIISKTSIFNNTLLICMNFFYFPAAVRTEKRKPQKNENRNQYQKANGGRAVCWSCNFIQIEQKLELPILHYGPAVQMQHTHRHTQNDRWSMSHSSIPLYPPDGIS